MRPRLFGNVAMKVRSRRATLVTDPKLSRSLACLLVPHLSRGSPRSEAKRRRTAIRSSSVVD
ncbi:hypothetical protein PGT21_012453 [Puccinia graminis f. sp. tritici]|uniref:Uncharacterized protein n=1 Tax=Puccinia graminis f. sp. tritici TaxID=56615 RepID=A0A5B0NCA9_PUCGR|nr:hypothetical protein PGT21_012453 [Puccinia graminis f. sp. tritici]KAA1136009.1 hypothetical protein PGTUg99_020694 [Puccinia graminis f. sp. tritici]